MKDPMKIARKELPKVGAEIVHDSPALIEFRMPNGSKYFASKRTNVPKLRALIESLRDESNELPSYVLLDKFPEVTKTKATAHFVRRFELMEKQEQLTGSELASALARPARVYSSGKRLAFERGRVVVIGQFEGEVFVLITVLWASKELWERNPRAEIDEVSNVSQ